MNSRICRKSQRQMFLLVSGGPSKGHQHGVSIQSFINLGKTFFRTSRLWNIAQAWLLARLFAYWSSFISQILDFLYWMVCIFIFEGVTVKTEHTMNNTTDLHGPCIIYIQVIITTPEGESWGYAILRSLSPPQTTSRLASLANFFFRPRRFFSPFFPKAEPGPRLLEDNPPNPGKVGHTTGVYVPYSFQTMVWVILRPTRTIQ